jgi:hypothetical protein
VRVVGGQQGGGEGPNGEDDTDVDEPARQLPGGDEDAGDEAERRTVARVTGCAASTLRIRGATAKPRQQKTTAPAMLSGAKAGAVRIGIDALQAAHPMTSSAAVSARAVSTPTWARPAMRALAGRR